MGFANIVFKIGDGTMGWPQNGPFDKIIVTAGAPVLPKTLADQLAPEVGCLFQRRKRQSDTLNL